MTLVPFILTRPGGGGGCGGSESEERQRWLADDKLRFYRNSVLVGDEGGGTRW
jgi:hypothetical protein